MYREFIIQAVNSHPGITGIDLSISVMNRINPINWSTSEYLKTLDECIVNKEIVAFMFEIPKITGLKAVYFPIGTTSWNS